MRFLPSLGLANWDQVRKSGKFRFVFRYALAQTIAAIIISHAFLWIIKSPLTWMNLVLGFCWGLFSVNQASVSWEDNEWLYQALQSTSQQPNPSLKSDPTCTA